jgi:hypothetical protein
MHMCYARLMAASTKPAPTRTVVLLRPNERKRLEKLASRDSVSSGEILRRGIHAYEEHTSASEQKVLATLLHEMNESLDGALTSIRSARSEIRENLDKIQQMRKHVA